MALRRLVALRRLMALRRLVLVALGGRAEVHIVASNGPSVEALLSDPAFVPQIGGQRFFCTLRSLGHRYNHIFFNYRINIKFVGYISFNIFKYTLLPNILISSGI